jgi:LysR family transcriptional regulator, cyn operon transcriptional activator
VEINLEWYRVFYWTAKTGTLSKAAERLHITQPAVSHTLKQLESRLGGQLFFRSSRGVKLTVEGEVLFRYVEQAFSFMEIGERAIADMHNLGSGEVNIGASDTLCRHYLLPYLEQFHRQYPHVRIRVTNRTTPETITLLKDGRIDFGVVSLPAAYRDVDCRAIAPLQDCLVGGQAYAHLAGRQEPLAIASLSEYPLLTLEPGGTTRSVLDEHFAACGVPLSPEFELGSLDLLAQFAKSGFGLAFVIRDFIAEELAGGELFEIPFMPTIPPRHIGVATLRGVPLSAASRAFLSLLP